MKDETTFFIVVILVLGWLYTVGAAPDDTVRVARVVSGSASGWRDRFAVDLLHRLGNDVPTPETVALIVGWTNAEDHSDGAFSRNNPLNTTMCGYNMIGAINSDGACGVQTYATYKDGLDATVATLVLSSYTEIVAGLQTNDPERAYKGIIESPWASSHYGGSFDW